MAEPRVNRKLAAILSADVVGYSKRRADDETATVDTLKQYRAAVGRVVERHKGRIVNAPGDNILAEFASAVEAVQAAVEIQISIQGRNHWSPVQLLRFKSLVALKVMRPTPSKKRCAMAIFQPS